MVVSKDSPETVLYVCPMCGMKFNGGEAAKCSACSKLGSCNMVMCPNCGYELPSEQDR